MQDTLNQQVFNATGAALLPAKTVVGKKDGSSYLFRTAPVLDHRHHYHRHFVVVEEASQTKNVHTLGIIPLPLVPKIVEISLCA